MITATLTLERRADGGFSDLEQQALLGFLGGYSGVTRDAYALDLRQFATWCQQRQLALFQVARPGMFADVSARARRHADARRPQLRDSGHRTRTSRLERRRAEGRRFPECSSRRGNNLPRTRYLGRSCRPRGAVDCQNSSQCLTTSPEEREPTGK